MKKLISITVLGLALSGLSAGVMAQDSYGSNGEGGYVGVKIGQSHWRANGDSSNETGYGVQGGYRFALAPNQSIGPELGYIDFGDVKRSDDFSRSSLRGKALTLGAAYRYSFMGTPVYVAARAGYERAYERARVTVYDVGSARVSDHSNGYYAGLGVGYDLTSNSSLVASYDYHRANDVFDGNDHINNGVASLGYEYRF